MVANNENGCYRAVIGGKVFMGEAGGKGNETPHTRFILSVSAVPLSGPYGHPQGPAVDIFVEFTPRQMAQIVDHFFCHITDGGNVFTKMLQRLFKKRSAVMTSPSYQVPGLGDDADGQEMDYVSRKDRFR